MKIAMIGLRGIPATYGGVENVVENLSLELVNLGNEVSVYCRSQYCPNKIKDFKGVKLKYFPTINTKHTETIFHTFISSLNAMFSNYDIVHYHAMGNAIFTFLPRITGKKTLLTLHGLDYEREKWGSLAKNFLKLNEKLSLKFPNAVVSVSENIKEHYYDRYKKDIYYVPNGVNFYEKMPLNRLKRFGLKKGYILFLSRIVPEKGLHYLIEAFKKIKTDKQLVIVGDAIHTETYFKKIKDMSDNDKRIVFTGALFNEDKQEAFSNASIFVLPSTMEGMPIVLLEAMSYGLPVLASNIKSNQETGKDFINYFKYMDTESLKDNLIYMLKNYNLVKKKAEKAKNYVYKTYNWKDIAKKYIEIYESLLKI
ncbi:MAG: glycosyltransferase family 4 protein [Candidatus Woesearchaeota archaeon]